MEVMIAFVSSPDAMPENAIGLVDATCYLRCPARRAALSARDKTIIGRIPRTIRVLDGRVEDEPVRGAVLLGHPAQVAVRDRADHFLAARVEDLDRDVVGGWVDDEVGDRLARAAGDLLGGVVGQ